jgi:small nuclear ribonucleoprotein (snRNP)-like protein
MSSVKNSQIWHEKASGSQIYGFDSFMNVNLHNAECMILCIFVPQTNPLTAEIVEH